MQPRESTGSGLWFPTSNYKLEELAALHYSAENLLTIRPVEQHTPDSATVKKFLSGRTIAPAAIPEVRQGTARSEGSFYESAGARDARFEKLVHTVTADDPEWMQKFIPWLRAGANMRSASIVMACEYVRAGGPNAARVVDSALQRPDEPGEAVGYWLSKYGRQDGQAVLPFSLKRGVARAASRLYSEWSAIKYDGQNNAIHFGDIVLLTRPKPASAEQNDLFKYLRYRWVDDDKKASQFELLRMLVAFEQLQAMPTSDRREALRAATTSNAPALLLREAGMSWEQLAGWLPGGMDAEAWEAVIPNMGAMALVRNLRNFDNAGISDAAYKQVVDKITDEDEIRKSRQFPIRFFTAWKNVGSLRWGQALEEALKHSVKNVPELLGRSLILVDRSGSMFNRTSGRSQITNADAAAVFGTVLAVRSGRSTLVQYGTRWEEIRASRANSVLRTVEQFRGMGGTDTWGALNATYAGHDRVIIITDEQANPGRLDTVVKCPVYTFNLVGYRVGHIESGVNNHYTFGGGLSDACFNVLSALESRQNSGWPWEVV